MKRLYIFIVLFSGLINFAVSQPSNDNCSGATSITIPTPPACPSGDGTTVTVSGTTVGSTASSPYPYMVGCSTGGNQQAPANDVWFQFTATGTTLNINLTTSFATPNIGLWTGSCGSLTGVDCASGTAGGTLAYTLTSLTPGTTYYLQLSGNTSSATGTYTLTLDNDIDCNNCLQTATFTATPAPLNGTYQAGQTVQFCFTVSSFTEVSSNWFHGVEFAFGPGWNLASLTTTAPAQCSYDPPGPGNPANGAWGWYNSVTSSATGSSYGPGFFFEYAGDADANPGNNYGDATNGSCTWTFCVTITTSTVCTQGADLSVSVNTLADGESGSWTSPACSGDPNYSINAYMSCCVPPTMTSSSTSSICSGNAVNLAFTATPASTFSWIAANNANTTGESTTSQSTSTLSDVITNTTSATETVIYTVTPIATSGGCAGTPQTVSVTVVPPPVMTSTTSVTACSGDALNINLTSNVASSYTWIASNNANTTGESTTTQTTSTINNTIINNSSIAQTVVYTVTPTSTSGSCLGTPQQVTVTVNPPPVMTSTTSASVCSGVVLNIALTSDIGSTYSWIAANNANTTGESTTAQSSSTINNTITNSTATTQTVTYTVTPTSTAGCVGTPQTVNVSVNPLPNASAGAAQVITCSTSTVSLNGSSTSAPVTYSWAGPGIVSGGSSATANVNAAGTYTLTVSNSTTGCANTATVSVTTNTTAPNISVAAGPTITCTNATVTISGNSTTGGATFAWTGPTAGTPAGTTPAASSTNITTGGTYTLTVTDPANGCTSTGTAVVSTNTTVPNVGAISNQTITCTTTTVTLSGSSSTGGASFAWTGPTSGTPAGSTPTSSSTGVSSAGTYTLTVTDPANGCTNTGTATVSTNTTVPNVNGGLDQILTCATTTVTLSGSSSTGGATFSWTGPTSGTPAGSTPTAATTNVSATGAYTLTVTDPANGCTATDNAVVSPDANIPNVSVGSNQTLTCTTNTVTLTASSTTGGATFAWTGPTSGTPAGTTPTSSSTDVTATGTYTVTVTNTSNGCSNTGTVLVSTNTTTPNANAGSGQTLTCTTTTVTLSGSSTTGGATFAWTGPTSGTPAGNTSATASTDVTAPGTYTLTVTDPANGCISTATALVSTNTTMPDVNAGSNPTITCTVTTVTLNGNSTTAGVTFAWTGPLSGTPAGTTPSLASTDVTSAGTYTLTVTDPSNGCTATATASVGTNTLTPDVNAGADQTLTCAATVVTLTGSSITAGAIFNWEGPSAGTPAGTTPTSTSTDVSATGTYTLTVTDPSNGCTSTDQVVVSPDANLPNITAGNSQTITCSNLTATVTGASSTSNVSYAWAGPAIISGNANDTATVNAPGTYTLTVTDNNNGCSNSTTIQVGIDTVVPVITLSSAQQLTCVTTTVTISASTGSTTSQFNWNGNGIVSPANSDSVDVNATGTYTVVVTDPNNGCSSTDSIVVTSNTTQPDANAGSDLNFTCSTTTLSLAGSSLTTGATFDWSGSGITGGTTDDTVSVNTTGQFILTVTDPANGCTNSDTVNVIPDSNLPNVSAGTDQTINCLAATATLNGSTTTANTNYTWNGPAGFTATTSSVTVLQAGSYTLTVTDTTNNCVATDIVVVSDSTQAPGANAGSDDTLTCSVTSVTLNGSSSTPGTTFSWNGPTGFSSSSQSVSVTASGVYTLTVTNTQTGCVSVDSVSILGGSGLPNANAGTAQSINCSTTSATLNGSSTTSGVIYSWSGPNGFNSGSATPTVTDSGTYVLTVTDPSNGCSSTASVIVSLDTLAPNAGITASANSITCVAPAVTLTGSSNTPGATLVWTDTSGPMTGNPVSTTTAGTFTLTVTNPANGCTTVQTTNITMNNTPPAIAATATTDTLNCANTTSTISATGSANYSYSWSGPNGFTSTNQNAGSTATAGTYILSVTDPANGCTATDSVMIVQGPNPSASFTANPVSGTAPLTVTYNNTSTSGFTGFIWTFGNGDTSLVTNPSNVYTAPGTYVVQLIGFGQCSDTAYTTITVYPQATITVPNIFTPNADGINDLFTIYSEGMETLKVEIFNRWGSKLYEFEGTNGYWDGNGSPDGTYYYFLKGTTLDKKEINSNGYFMLTR